MDMNLDADKDPGADVRNVAEALSGTWQETQGAREALSVRGAEAVAPVLGVLCDEASPVDWTVSCDVLVRIGEPALLPLAGVLAAAGTDEVSRRAAYALGRLRVGDMAVYLPLLDHPDPRVRQAALYAFQSRTDQASPFLGRITRRLGDSEPEVRERAVWALRAIGEPAVPELLRLRREPASGPLIRRHALEALSEIGGPAVLDERDLAALRRLTRVKLFDEVQEGLHLCGSWYAVPTGDQAAVLDVFGLTDPEPVTLCTGASAWNHDQHVSRRDRHDNCARVFVSPVLDGWTLVFGDTSEDTHLVMAEEEEDESALNRVARRRCAELSSRFGSAQWYGMSCGDGWTAWCVAEQGEVIRHYDVFEAEENGDPGPPHPAESGLRLPHLDEDGLDEDGLDEDDSDGDDPDDEDSDDEDSDGQDLNGQDLDVCDATHIAARLSVDPEALGLVTSTTGTGVLALTACGREHGHPAGALRF